MSAFRELLRNVCLLLIVAASMSNAFQQRAFSRSLTSTRLHSSAPKLNPEQERHRDTLLSRNGPYFKLDRSPFQGKVEFGATANLVTQLGRQANQETISGWLSDERRVALSIWDEKLINELGNSVYQLQVMSLQFVTISLSPRVDVKMWTDKSSDLPVFSLQSVSFDPNLEILPGVGVTADSLGIVIEVAGELRPTADGKGVTGKIAFQTSGDLPPPMLLLPEPVIKAAADAISDTVSRFAIQSFQKGATQKYKEYAAAAQTKEN